MRITATAEGRFGRGIVSYSLFVSAASVACGGGAADNPDTARSPPSVALDSTAQRTPLT